MLGRCIPVWFVRSKCIDETRRGFCPNLVALAEILTVAAHEAPHIISTAVTLCMDRILVTSLFKGSRRFDPLLVYRPGIIRLKREDIERGSDCFLRDPRLDMGVEWAVVIEGSEYVGDSGPRKQWISQLIERFFSVENQKSVWKYTDESKTYITLGDSENEILIRATGRVLGLALRNKIPMGISFAPSFIKMLRLLYDSSFGMDELLREEDPAFLAGLEWVSTIDWTDAPMTASWQTFEGLLLIGFYVVMGKENANEFLRLRKQSKLFVSKRVQFSQLIEGVTEVVGAGVFGMLTEQEIIDRLSKRRDGIPGQLPVGGIL
jgi:hypothetical protein